VKREGHNRERSESLSYSPSPTATDVNDAALLASTQYENERDAGFAHLGNPDLDDAHATQKFLERSELLGENRPAENGILESVTMINFMCHEKLHVTLGPLLNFITGPNGSGKSTTLTAIILCLGAKASTTNRGGSLKSFIMEGRDQASLIIHIKNQGTDAYQPDVFGKTIIVERHFSRAGTSGFKLKSSSGRLVSNKKADIEEMIEYFQMQIDNPMSVLSQDNAREFIAGAEPGVKYRYFVKGVQLEQLDNDYRLVSETADAMSAKLEINRSRVKKLEKNMKLAQEKKELVDKHAGMRDAVRRLTHQAAWAQVEHQERVLNDTAMIVAEAEEAITQAEGDCASKSEIFQKQDILVEQAGEAVKQALDALAPFKERELEAKDAYDRATQEEKNIFQEQRTIRGHLDAARKKVSTIDGQIAVELKRIEDANGGAHTRKLADMEDAKQEKQETQSRLDELDLELEQLDMERQSALKDFEKSKAPVEAKRKEIDNCEGQLQLLSRDMGNIMAGFDSKMPRLLNMIRDDSGFREKPIGPIGLHIRLLKPIWSSVLERSLGSTLSGFIVTSKADQLRLSALVRKLNLDFCPVIIGNHQAVDTRGHEPDEEYDTVLRVLEIDNELVRSQLVIGQVIEQTILIERRQDAMKILYDGPRPQNVKQCFCLHDTKRGHGIRLGFMAGSADPSSAPILPTAGKPRMKTDLESQIAYQRDTLNQLQGELRHLESRQRELQQVLKKRSQTAEKHKRDRQELIVRVQRIDSNLEGMQDELDRDNVEDGRLEALRDELREAKEEYTLHGGSWGEVVMAMEASKALVAKLQHDFEGIKEQIRQHEKRIERAERRTEQLRQARQLALKEKNISIEAVSAAKNAKLVTEQKRDRQQQRVEEFIREASKICGRVPIDDGETMESIDAKLVKLSDAIKNYNRKIGGSDEEISRACEQAVTAYRTALRQLQNLEELYEALKRTYSDRLDRWRRFQRYISARTRTSFTYLLSERGFRGRVLIDHQKKLLDIKVEPDTTLKSAAGRATKTLSGGEKSFSSVCLLLSVWEAMGSPLRCLDEYDIFMDQVNRDISTSLIVSHFAIPLGTFKTNRLFRSQRRGEQLVDSLY
jgi:chromosome segregation ATPase